MAAGAWTLTNGASKLITDAFNLDTMTVKMSLHTSAGNVAVTSTTFAALTGEVSNTGYTAGGDGVPADDGHRDDQRRQADAGRGRSSGRLGRRTSSPSGPSSTRSAATSSASARSTRAVPT